jgi:hypothetical protein
VFSWYQDIIYQKVIFIGCDHIRMVSLCLQNSTINNKIIYQNAIFLMVTMRHWEELCKEIKSHSAKCQCHIFYDFGNWQITCHNSHWLLLWLSRRPSFLYSGKTMAYTKLVCKRCTSFNDKLRAKGPNGGRLAIK